MSDTRGWQMAEQEHAARLAAVKASYEAEVKRLREALEELRKFASGSAVMNSMDAGRVVDAQRVEEACEEALSLENAQQATSSHPFPCRNCEQGGHPDFCDPNAGAPGTVPDAKCVTTPDGGCEGTGCMHEASPATPTPEPCETCGGSGFEMIDGEPVGPCHDCRSGGGTGRTPGTRETTPTKGGTP